MAKATKPAAKATKPAAKAAEPVKEPKAKKEISIKMPSGAKFKGTCISKRKTNSGDQVFLQMNGCVSRWFDAKDIDIDKEKD